MMEYLGLNIRMTKAFRVDPHSKKACSWWTRGGRECSVLPVMAHHDPLFHIGGLPPYAMLARNSAPRPALEPSGFTIHAWKRKDISHVRTHEHIPMSTLSPRRVKPLLQARQYLTVA